MDIIRVISLFSLVLNAVIFILLLASSKAELGRIRNIIDILTNGGYNNCPFYRDFTKKGGKRCYDPE